jgi:Spy/CpxP family protein refolding chaperone
MKKTLFGIGVATAVIALAATLATAQGARAGRGGGPDGRGGRFGGPLAGLNLSEDQRARVADIERAGRDEAAPIEKDLRVAQNALHCELFADARDAGKVGDLSARVLALQHQLADLHVKTASSLADVLTAEQRATVRAREGRSGGPGRGGPGRGFGRFHQVPKAR